MVPIASCCLFVFLNKFICTHYIIQYAHSQYIIYTHPASSGNQIYVSVNQNHKENIARKFSGDNNVDFPWYESSFLNTGCPKNVNIF